MSLGVADTDEFNPVEVDILKAGHWNSSWFKVVDIIKTFIIHVVNTNLFDYIFLEVKSIDDIFFALIEDDAPLFAHPEQISHFPSHSNKIIYADKLINKDLWLPKLRKRSYVFFVFFWLVSR